MELLQLKYFQTVARLEHMTKAAEQLQIAQPSLSKTISRLEEDLGVELFDREHRKISLNAAGKVFLNRVDRAFAELNEGQRELNQFIDQDQKSITLAVTIPRVLPSLLGSFLSKHPDVRFQQFLKSVSSMKKMLLEGDLDYCISSIPIEGEGVRWEPLITEEIFLIVPPNHQLAERESIRLEEVKDEAFISMNTGYGFRNLTDQFCREAGFVQHIAFEGDEPTVISDLVRQGLGVAFVSELSWVPKSGQFPHKLRIVEPTCQRTIGLAWSEKRYFTPIAKQFRLFVLDYFLSISQSK
ncbi:LysR family transcriptional regulator [Lysinibacillus irui]|uniref:LysR family transcriptional regulator n=1 Tax=Lysinibacillus irui TaxID=2998077 RepID=A0AAJ5RKU4_9BACI|nr:MULTISPECIES: LysR family transcriptional regulator [Lysinibacillus]MEA0554657.1 LysR family transcriptional regulator [Lysinibacillus irui]MEA0564128.1 LysR family transcriptional regulator [Lysinibacillus irui]MEA0978769.1 LysR family transcriptional regulator [Lysinibacillus irui]MEA1044923.1 LysR family transcriptional regulator [Lysinibacillus irui]WDV06900.1 LysR family transcriptional regulator [Lysinibacillus irui]